MGVTQPTELSLHAEVVLIKSMPEEGIEKGQDGTLLDFVTGEDGTEGCVIEVHDGPVVAVPKSIVAPSGDPPSAG